MYGGAINPSEIVSYTVFEWMLPFPLSSILSLVFGLLCVTNAVIIVCFWMES